MKKISLLSCLVGTLLCTAAAPIAADNYPYCGDCCQWSLLDGKLNVGAEWLSWKTEQDNMVVGSVAEIQNFNDKENDAVIINACNKRPNFRSDNGYRVWVGYELPCDCWDIGVSYTYLPTSARMPSFFAPINVAQLEGQPAPQTLFATNTSDFSLLNQVKINNTNTTFQAFRAKWNSTLSYVDVDLGRTVCLGECFKFRPHVGFRAAWLDQKLRANGIFLEQPESTVLHSVFKEKFKGYGIEGGIWAEWYVGCGFSFVGHAGGSVLYSKFSLRDRQAVVSNVGSELEELIYSVSVCDSFWTGTPTADYFLGVKYDTCFCDMMFSAHVGWEQHIFFDMNRLSDNGGNLSTQGLTLGVDLSF
jgi:hypothetical protein